jgi:uncharacterized protein (DUF305 family)
MSGTRSVFERGMAIAVLVLALGGLWAGPAAASPLSQTQSDMDHLRGLSGQEFEIHWMSMMIEHHQGAVEMAQLAETRANHQEIKALSQNIIRDQAREIGEMTAWLKQWYNAEPMTGIMHEGMHGGMDMSMLQGISGDDFDRAFLMMMHEHHRGAVDMAELVPDRATHQELKTLAQNIMTSQEAEIMQMMDWAMTWYNLDLMAGTGATPPVGMPRTGGSSLTYLIATLLVAFAALTVAGGVWLRRKAEF